MVGLLHNDEMKMKTVDNKNSEVEVQCLRLHKPFVLESGDSIPQLEIAYTTHGKLNATKTNVVWICHALTANSNPVEWWPGLVGPGCLINPDEYFIVCANVVGSCYGSTGPLSINPNTEKPYYRSFPFISIRDMVSAHIELANYLLIDQIHLLLGGSLGGQQVLEWSIAEPERIKNQVLIATNAFHSAYGIAFNESQRLAIQADQTYYNDIPQGGQNGLKAARSIALISYRTYEAYNTTQKEDEIQKTEGFKAARYQQYQGEKLVNRFNAYAYVTLSKSMDSHNVGRHRGSIQEALSQIKANTVCIGISSDILFPPSEQKFLQQYIPGSSFVEIDSFYGHDGFLIEVEKLTNIIKQLL